MANILPIAFIILPISPALCGLSLFGLLILNSRHLKVIQPMSGMEKKLGWTFLILSLLFCFTYTHPEQHLAGFLSHYLMPLLLLLLFIQLIQRQILPTKGLIYASFILTFIGLGNYFLAWTYRLQLLRIPFYDQPFLFDIYLMYHFGRARSFAMHPNILGILLAMTLPLICWAYSQTQSKWLKLLIALALIAQIVCIGFTFSRASWLATVVGLSIYSYLRGGLHLLGKVLGGTFCIGLISLALFPEFFLSLYERAITLIDPLFHSNQQRVFIWTQGFYLLMLYPLKGVGILNFEAHYLFNSSIPAAHLHNLPLQILVESGLIAGTILLVLIAKLVLPTSPLDAYSPLEQAAWSGLMAYLFSSLFDYSIVDFRVLIFVTALMAIWLNHRQNKDYKNNI